jgi:hypothetical protein
MQRRPATLPPAAFESRHTIQIPPSERAKAAVAAFHAVRAELGALHLAHADHERIDEKQRQLIAVQYWAIEFATANEKTQKELAEKAEARLTQAEKNVVAATIDFDKSAPTGPDHAAKDLILTNARQAQRDAENGAMSARRNRDDARSLLEQAKGTAEGDLNAADENLKTARDRVFAADMKLKAAGNRPDLIRNARIEFDDAAKQFADAERERSRAEQAVPAPRPANVQDIKK